MESSSLPPVVNTPHHTETKYLDGRTGTKQLNSNTIQTIIEPVMTPDSPLLSTSQSEDKTDTEGDNIKNVETVDLQKQRREKKPFFYCQWIANYPKPTFGIMLSMQILPILLSGILFLAGYELFPLRFDVLPMEVYSVPYKLRDLAFQDRNIYENKFTRQLSDIGFANWERGLMFYLSSVDVYFDTDNGNVFTKEKLQLMKQIEKSITEVSGYKTEYCQTKSSSLDCKEPVSVIRYFDGTYGSISTVFNDSNFNNVAAVIYEAYTNNKTKSDFKYFLPKTFIITPTASVVSHTRAIIPIGCSLSGKFKCGDVASDATKPFLSGVLKERLESWRESVSGMDIYYYAYNMWVVDAIDLAMKDMLFALGSMTFIFGFMVFHTRSLWISGFAIMSIISSFLLGNLIYRVVIGFQYFGFFHVLGIFILLGIGADDLFVFYDAWRLTAFESYPSVAHRLSDAYSKAAFSMMITSLTTMVAFLTSGISPLLVTKSFGVFSAIIVFFNYLSVITFFPTVIIMYHLKFETFKWPCIQFCKRKSKKRSNSEEKDNTANTGTIKQKAVKSIHDKSYHTTMIENEYSNGINDYVANNSLVGNGNIASNGSQGIPKLNTKKAHFELDVRKSKTKQQLAKKQKTLIVFFKDYYFRFVTHKIVRFCLIPLFLFAIIFFAYQASRLEPNNENMKVLKESHQYRKAINLEQYGFRSSAGENLVTVYIVWGLKNKNRDDCRFSSINCVGTNVYDENFDPNPKENQQALMDFCDKLYNLTASEIEFYEIKKDSSGKLEIACFTNSLQTFLNKKGAELRIDLSMPLTWTKIQTLMDAESSHFESSKFNSSFPHILQTAVQYWMYDGYSMNFTDDYGMYNKFFGEEKGAWSQQLKSDSSVYYGNRMKYMAVSINTTINRFTTGYSEGIPKVEKWENFINSEVAKMPSGLQGGFQLTRDIWHWLYEQKEMEKNAVLGIAVGVSLAFPILCIATMNWIVGSLATLSICYTTVCVIGVIPLAGWKLGLLTSLNMCMLVGLAVDYVVHLAEGYRNSLHVDRLNRTRDMLEEMGPSVFSGACTTLGASIFMFFTQIAFSMQFGVFLFCTIGFSLFFSLGFFTVLVGLIGPQNNTGSLRPLFTQLKNCGAFCVSKCRKKTETTGKPMEQSPLKNIDYSTT